MIARLRGPALLALALFAIPFAAHAATVSIPVGDWTVGALGFVSTFVGAGIIWLLSKIGTPWAQKLRTDAAEQLLGRAVSYGINATAGAVAGKAVTVEVGNTVVATALNYAIEYGPARLIGWLGGEAGIRDKILARLTVPEDAAIVDGAIVPAG